MKPLLGVLITGPLPKKIRSLKRYAERKRNSIRSAEAVFTDIYAKNKWGGQKGEFCSGPGTADDEITAAYVSMLSRQISILGLEGKAFIDLGCGDFRIGKKLLPLCSSYIGVDVVKPLIIHNQREFEDRATTFVHLDIVEDELPEGDVCFIRQVLQHLSNKQIVSVLQKLKKYKYVFITEHYPTENDSIKPNLDRAHGRGTRLYKNSGVYLSKPPFALPEQSLGMVLEVKGIGPGEGRDQGVIRTFLYRPQG